MTSKWRVTKNPMMEGTPYTLCRLRDVHATDHSGNREYYGRYMASRDEAQRIADRLNGEAEQ